MTGISIIIPMYNHWDLTHNRLSEFLRYIPTNNWTEVILVDNGSEETQCSTGTRFWQDLKAKEGKFAVRYKRSEKNLGFGGGHNLGASIAKGDIFVFYSNDVKLSGNFAPELLDKLETEKKTLVGGRSIYWDSGWNKFNVGGRDYILPYLEGWFLATRREWWEELGGFDPRYGLCDYEDIDLSMTAVSRGFELIPLNSSKLSHISGVTASSIPNFDRQKQTEANRQVFWEKWKDILDEQ